LDPENRKEAEKHYDHLLDILLSSIRDNFGRDEFNYALDMVTLFDTPGHHTDFEKIVSEKKQQEVRLKENIRIRIEEQMRAQRSHMTFEELMQSIQAEDPREEERKQIEALRNFVTKNGYNDLHGDGFMN
jgi:ATP-dependent Lon protease